MAITRKEALKILSDKKEAPFSEEELNYMKIVEKYVDEEIAKQIESGCIYIDLYIASFKYNLSKKEKLKISDVRRQKLAEELIKKYIAGGWSHRLQLDDGLDGNMSGDDQWTLY